MENQAKTIRLCSYCQKPGHNRLNCPELKTDIEKLQAEKLRANKDSSRKLSSLGSVKKEEIETAVNVVDPIAVPVRVSYRFEAHQMVLQAFCQSILRGAIGSCRARTSGSKLLELPFAPGEME